ASSQPGLTHPISDRWAVSVALAAIAIARADRAASELYLRKVAVWLCDRYERDELGLAPIDASPDTEAAYLLGGAFESVVVPRRRESFAASVILDVLTALGLGETYELALNDFRAVGIMPWVVHVDDDAQQYETPGSARREYNVPYPEEWRPLDGWRLTAHHRTPESYLLQRRGRSWDLLAVSCVLRDRLYVAALREGLNNPA
ncbi:MAG: hypothetical protein ACYDAN_12980, partial [Candidatus Limnocylindrales bacterium]